MKDFDFNYKDFRFRWSTDLEYIERSGFLWLNKTYTSRVSIALMTIPEDEDEYSVNVIDSVDVRTAFKDNRRGAIEEEHRQLFIPGGRLDSLISRYHDSIKWAEEYFKADKTRQDVIY